VVACPNNSTNFPYSGCYERRNSVRARAFCRGSHVAKSYALRRLYEQIGSASRRLDRQGHAQRGAGGGGGGGRLHPGGRGGGRALDRQCDEQGSVTEGPVFGRAGRARALAACAAEAALARTAATILRRQRLPASNSTLQTSARVRRTSAASGSCRQQPIKLPSLVAEAGPSRTSCIRRVSSRCSIVRPQIRSKLRRRCRDS